MVLLGDHRASLESAKAASTAAERAFQVFPEGLFFVT